MMKENIFFLIEKKGESQSLGSPIKLDILDKQSSTYPASKIQNFFDDLDKTSEEIKEDTIPLAVVKEEQMNDKSCYSEIDNEDSVGNYADKEEFNSGRWNEEEHKKFIEAILLYGNEWKRVQQYIKTRSSTQARSHAQKFFIRLKTKLGANNISLDNVDDQDSDKKQKFFDSIYYLLNQCLCDNGMKDGDKINTLMKEKFSTHGRDKLIKMIFNFHTKSGDYKRRKSSKTESICDSNSEFSLAKQIQSCNINDIDNNMGYVKGFKLVEEEGMKNSHDSNILSPKSKLFKIEKDFQIKNRKKTFDFSAREFITSAYTNDLNTSYPNVCEISSTSASMPYVFNSGIVVNSDLNDLKNMKENMYEKLKSFFGVKINEKKENPNPLWMNLIEENLNLDYNKTEHNATNGNPFNINFDNLDGCYCNNYHKGNQINNFFEDDYINSHTNNMNVEIEKMFTNLVNLEYDYQNSFLNN